VGSEVAAGAVVTSGVEVLEASGFSVVLEQALRNMELVKTRIVSRDINFFFIFNTTPYHFYMYIGLINLWML
jgi:hypothetical protein